MQYELDTSAISDTCDPIIIVYAKEGCPVFSIHALYSFCQGYKSFIGIFLIVLGGFLISAGGRFF